MSKFRFNIGIIVIVVSLVLALPSCGHREVKKCEKKCMVTTIPPLQGIVKEIVGDDFEVVALLPSGSSPESYSPTPSQLVDIEEAEMVFCIGTIEFERVIMERFAKKGVNNLMYCSVGTHLIQGDCGHEHAGKEHNHGVDPHIWLSVYELENIAKNVANAICSNYLDSAKYKTNSQQLINKIKSRQTEYKTRIEEAQVDHFLIYHPALGYLARDYGLEQIALEDEGKAPTPAAMANIADRVERGPRKMTLIYQEEYPESVVKPLAEILDVNLVKVNLLSENILTELDKVINIISTPQDGAK